jgi:putative PIN family toxin of toxin-antitoxin system
MRVICDTNVLISALISDKSPPADVLRLWRRGRFELLVSLDLFEEIHRVPRTARIRARIKPAKIGRLVNEVRVNALVMGGLEPIDKSRDPFDNYLLALAEAGKADFLVTGDKAGLLASKRFATARIVNARQFLESL